MIKIHYLYLFFFSLNLTFGGFKICVIIDYIWPGSNMINYSCIGKYLNERKKKLISSEFCKEKTN